jgi:hypothetical protein
MLTKNSALFEIENDSSSIIDIPSSPILLPITDYNSLLKNKNNKFINNSSLKYENNEENQLKLKEMFEGNDAYIFGNLFKFSSIEIDDALNNNINLEESKVPKISQDIVSNSTNKEIKIMT